VSCSLQIVSQSSISIPQQFWHDYYCRSPFVAYFTFESSSLITVVRVRVRALCHHHPTEIIRQSKVGWKSAYCRLHNAPATAVFVMVLVHSFFLVALRLTFGGAPNPSHCGAISVSYPVTYPMTSFETRAGTHGSTFFLTPSSFRPPHSWNPFPFLLPLPNPSPSHCQSTTLPNLRFTSTTSSTATCTASYSVAARSSRLVSTYSAGHRIPMTPLNATTSSPSPSSPLKRRHPKSGTSSDGRLIRAGSFSRFLPTKSGPGLTPSRPCSTNPPACPTSS
jgi:hypothetical protein